MPGPARQKSVANMQIRSAAALLITAAVIAGGPTARARQQTTASRLVLATVTDAQNRVLADLGPDDFVVSENGEMREVVAVFTADYPVIVDAGVGTASDAAIAMELGCDGVLMNTAIAAAQNPVLMASAMKKAVEAGREACLAGRMSKKLYSASPSSPVSGTIASYPPQTGRKAS